MLKMYKQFRIEKSVTDGLMTKAVQNVTSRRFFKSWYSLARKRQGLEIFA